MKQEMEQETYECDQGLAIRIRDLCGLMLRLLSDLREEKWLAEEKALQELRSDEMYRWILGTAEAIEDAYEFLIFHSRDEVRYSIDEIEKEVMRSAEEYEEKCKSK